MAPKIYTVLSTERVAPKVGGGLACIEEEIRENISTLRVDILRPENSSVDGLPGVYGVKSRWFVDDDTLVAEVFTAIREQAAGCTLFEGATQLFSGSVEDWWYAMSSLLTNCVREATES